MRRNAYLAMWKSITNGAEVKRRKNGYTMKNIHFFLALPLFILTSLEIMADETDLHQLWDQQLEQYVAYSPDEGPSAVVNYKKWGQNTGPLQRYLETLENISVKQYKRWPEAKQLAFLINAYNAYTVNLVLSHYSQIDSIKDIGSLWSSPWDIEVGNLLGKSRTLDDIEHGMIRGTIDGLKREGFNGFDEPRIHFAVNCASRSCPPLRQEAYTGHSLDRQLEAQTKQFLGNTRENRYTDGQLEVSKIFDWYRDDFTAGWKGASSLNDFFLLYADTLNMDAEAESALKNNAVAVTFNDYNWALNDKVD